MDKENSSGNGYAKRPLWQWVLIYVTIGVVVYGVIYYFVLAKKGKDKYSASSVTPPAPTTTPQASASATETEQNTITLSANGFLPDVLTVKAGTTVTWSNQTNNNATVNSDPHPTHTGYAPLNLGNFPDRGTLALTFDKPGIYKYHNHLNPSHQGQVIVQ